MNLFIEFLASHSFIPEFQKCRATILRGPFLSAEAKNRWRSDVSGGTAVFISVYSHIYVYCVIICIYMCICIYMYIYVYVIYIYMCNIYIYISVLYLCVCVTIRTIRIHIYSDIYIYILDDVFHGLWCSKSTSVLPNSQPAPRHALLIQQAFHFRLRAKICS
jgi:hypothetical protein